MSAPLEAQAAFAAALVNPALPVPAGLVSPSGDSDARRFAVYRNNVHVGLVGVLAAKYPVCARLVGADFFTAMARLYVADHKPASPIMQHYGASFATFIEGFDPASAVPYLADMARLEAAWSIAYNAADMVPMSITVLATIDQAALPELRLAAHPAAGLIHSAFPVGSIWSAHQAEGVAVRPGAEAVLVSRPALEVMVTVIPQADALFLHHLFAGAALGVAAAAATGLSDAFDVGRALVGLCNLGAFAQPLLKP
jgi:hypothetical protein